MWKSMLWQKKIKLNKMSWTVFFCVHKEKCDKEKYKWDNMILSPKSLTYFFKEMSLTMDVVYFRQPFAICQSFSFSFLNGLALIILYEPQTYWSYLGFRNMYILSTFDQNISLNWEYYPEQCPILLSIVY